MPNGPGAIEALAFWITSFNLRLVGPIQKTYQVVLALVRGMCLPALHSGHCMPALCAAAG